MTTIRDVALLSNVSVATVSRVLNEPTAVRRDKRERVESAIRELGFTPSRAAQGLKSKSFRTIALIVTDISNNFFGQIARSVEEACGRAGYSVLLCNIGNSEDKLAHFLRDLPRHGIDGVIICGGAYLERPAIRPLLEEFVRSGPPLVLSGHQAQGLDVPSVVSDSDSALAQVVEHLRENGHRELAYLAGPSHSAIYRDRSEKIQKLAADRGLSLDISSVREVDVEYESGRRAAKALIAQRPSIDAIICASDQIAVGAMRGLRDLGKSIPGDVVVIGFDDTPLAAFSEPPLSSVSVDIDRIASLAAERLLSTIAGHEVAIETIVDCDLVVRESSR